LKPLLALTRGDALSEETCRRLTLAATVLGSSMAYVTAINVAVPAIGADLGIDLGGQQWVLLSYSLALASLYLVAGALGDRHRSERCGAYRCPCPPRGGGCSAHDRKPLPLALHVR
jgi:MFS family permease